MGIELIFVTGSRWKWRGNKCSRDGSWEIDRFFLILRNLHGYLLVIPSLTLLVFDLFPFEFFVLHGLLASVFVVQLDLELDNMCLVLGYGMDLRLNLSEVRCRWGCVERARDRRGWILG